MLSGFKIALIQMTVGKDKNVNLENAVKFIRKAADNGASLVVLPECFNCPYGTSKWYIWVGTII